MDGRVMNPDRACALAVAAVVYEAGSRIEEFFATLAARLRAEGIAVSGLLQRSLRARAEDRCSFEMEDLGQGVRYRISQDLGPGSDACSIDRAAIASASVVLRRAILDAPDVVLVNKFGALEAAGEGLREDMNAVVAAGLPLLTTVSREQLDDWRAYVGGASAELPMDLDAVVAWAQAQRRTRPA
jgi:nucleoside-triphosphatase THEP1